MNLQMTPEEWELQRILKYARESKLMNLKTAQDYELEQILKYAREHLIWDLIHQISNIDVPLYSTYQIYL